MEISVVFVLVMSKHRSIYSEARNTPSAVFWIGTCYFGEHMARGVLNGDGLVLHSDKYYLCVRMLDLCVCVCMRYEYGCALVYLSEGN